MQADKDRRTALVTGSSNGIGEAVVLRLARLNYKLVVTGRSREDIERVANECQRLSPSGERPLEIVANLELEEDQRRLFHETLAHFNGRLDLLVNNAGFSTLPLSEPSAQMANFRRTLQVNLNSAVYLTLLAREPLERTARDFCAGKPTSLIFISSVAGERPLEDYAYCTSKSALNMFSKCMASQLAPLVRVNCIAPGPIETKIIERSGIAPDQWRAAMERMMPLCRLGQPDEVAECVLFLADQERAGFIAGAQLTIDGGITCARISLT